MNTYFISDTHFGHKNIMRFERTQFNSIEEHDAHIIEQVNKVVKLSDTLYVLGDIGLGNTEMIRNINGRKILIMGNHDKRSKEEFQTYFAEVYDHPVYLTKKIVLSHEPIPVLDSVLNVHGHMHGSILNKPNYLNVNIHIINYVPVKIEKLYDMASKLPKENTNFLEEWYADSYKMVAKDRKDVITDENGLVDVAASKKLRESLVKDEKGFVVNVF